MHEYLVFVMSERRSKEEFEKVSKLNKILSQVGVRIKLDNQILNNDKYSVLTINYDTDNVHKKLSRGAGRKRIYAQRNISPEEVRELLKEKSAEKVAKELGISRSSLFRKLKEAEENGFDYLC